MSFKEAQDKVREFQEKFGQPAPSSPQDVDDVNWAAHLLRGQWIVSEIVELGDALFSHDMAESADAYIDVIYLALGGLVALGIDGGPLFDAVHAANMTKVKLPGVPKIAKPPGFQHPDIGALIDAQRKPSK